jgi:hypothetical protein
VPLIGSIMALEVVVAALMRLTCRLDLYQFDDEVLAPGTHLRPVRWLWPPYRPGGVQAANPSAREATTGAR